MQLGKPEKEIVMIRSGVDKDAWRARFESFDRNVCSPPRMCLQMRPRLSCTARNCSAGSISSRPIASLCQSRRSRELYCLRRRGTQCPELERAVVSLGVTDRVGIPGFVNDSQLPGAYKAAVLPSEYDVCPLVIPEAMFSGLPVLLSVRV
jgi:glycosyltransferase involved in cell wall biosynthesis